jgi:sugar phosphate permease
MRAASPAVERSESPPPVSAPLRAFHGWRIVAVMLAAQTVTGGSTTYAYSLFLKPVGAELGIDPARLGLGQTGYLLAMMLVGPMVGAALDQRSIRRLVAAGAVLFALGFTGMAVSSSVWALAACYWSVVSLGALLTGPVPANKLVTHWFVRMRGRALGISSIGASAGGFLIVPLCAWAIPEIGWRGALLGVAAISGIAIAPLAWRVLVDRPEDCGQTADGDGIQHVGSEGSAEQRIPFRALLARADFWGIALAFGLAFAVVAGLMSFFGLWADRAGLGGTAPVAISALSIASIPGKVLFGTAAERIDPRKLVWLGLGMQMAFVGVLWSEPAAWLLVAASALVGLSLGGLLPMQAALIAGNFGRASFGSVMGAMGPIMTPLMVLAISAAASTRFSTSYSSLFEVFLVVQLLAALALLLVRPQRRI